MKIQIEFETDKARKIGEEELLKAYIRYSLKMFNIKSIEFIEK